MTEHQVKSLTHSFYQASVHLHQMIAQSFDLLNAARGWPDYKNFNDSEHNPSLLAREFQQKAAGFMGIDGQSLPSTEHLVLFDQVTTSLEEITPTLDLVSHDWKRLFPSTHEGIAIPFDGLTDQETAQQLKEAFDLFNAAFPAISEELAYYIIPNTRFLLDDLQARPN